VKSLSGGERNRLLLARLFTRPSNVLVLDEPTNDLDLETLELLEAQLAEWPGTVLLVSHDRVFLDNVVTSTLAFEGGGIVREYVGGYEDWLRQRAPAEAPQAPARTETAPSTRAPDPGEVRPAGARKLSYNEQREYERLPAAIETLEAEHRALSDRVAGPEFYREPADDIAAALARLEAVQAEIAAAYQRWDALDSIRPFHATPRLP
jgi:ATP-binding cassette subfamily F protein uup